MRWNSIMRQQSGNSEIIERLFTFKIKVLLRK